MGLLFYFVPMLLLQYCFLGSLAIATFKNLTTDQSALLAFKDHVIDPRGILTNNWSILYPVCSWVGISCGVRHRRVTALNLSDMGLGGAIPPHLGNLSFLVYLNVSYNNFHGHLPSKLGQLRGRLKFISFSYNKLSESLPAWIGVLSKLQKLGLRHNNFTGPIPNFLFNLSKLEGLDLRFNNLDGGISSKFGNLSKLERLNLGNNNLQGAFHLLFLCISAFACLQNSFLINKIQNSILGWEPESRINMKYLLLESNNLCGPIPPTIFNISSITIITLYENQLSGHLPSMTGHSLPNIGFLSLFKNKLIGTIPNSISNASKLHTLELSENSFSGLVPNSFGDLRFLSFLNLGNNQLTSESSIAGWSFLSSLTNCRNLTYLALASNPLGGVLPSLIGNFSTSLQQLLAHDCKLKGGVPQEIGNLGGLIALSLRNNELSGTIPTTVGRLKQIQAIDLQKNNLRGTIPNDICHLKGLNILSLSENKLSRHIPQCLVTLISLRELYLDSNEFTSGIPSSMWSLEYILQINLLSNLLSGSLPSNIQNLKVLIYLDLSRNQLSGDIPVINAGLKDLANLSLAGNQFEGPIPESFGSLPSLESLDLSENNLSGKNPKLEGEIPTKGPFKNFLAQSFLWNYALCGAPRLQVPPCKKLNNSKGSKKTALFVLKYIFPCIISTILIAMVIIFIVRRRNKRSTKNANQEVLLPLATWRRTSYLDIQRATNGFDECNLLGKGSFGSVYKATLSDGTNVAIKVFHLQLERAFKSFDSECEILRNVRHRNLIKIISTCCNIDFKALVLEFMPNGSLEKWLYSHNYFLDILERLNIMIDVGLALEYLHHGHSLAPVVHCDLKPSNILLDEDMVAHVSDFGISKLLGDGDDSVTQTMTMATIGYMAPEYGSEGIVSTKCDVYSYGVLLMETFTRKKPTDEMFIGEMSLRDWVNKSLSGELTQVIDANLARDEQSFFVKMDCLSSIMHLALDCCMESPDQRIYMTDAAAKLKKIKEKFLDDVASTN
ncbi:protein kinase domain-containing protein [Citrus sinensis]|nr:protein kinase domain-containing protein [Citrus sinensis]